MTEEGKEETTPFDAEWRFEMLSRRIIDVLSLIDELKAKDKSLSARISRMNLARLEDEEGEEGGDPERGEKGFDIESLPIDQRALLATRLLEKLEKDSVTE